MAQVSLLALLGASALGLTAGLVARKWLRADGHRYVDEAVLPQRSWWWVPVLTALLELLTVFSYPQQLGWAAVLGLAIPVLVVLVAVDADVHRLPDLFTRPLLPVAGAALAVLAITRDAPEAVLRALIAAVALFAFYWLLAFVSGGRGMGAGDVKLAPSLGMLLGWLSLTHVVVATLVAFLLGALWGVGQRLRGGGGELPFGPFMVFGALLLVLAPGLVRVASWA